MDTETLERIEQEFKRSFGGRPDLMVRAPGRVNLIGEHTDYNDGFVFPVAIDRAITIAGRARRDQMVRLYSLNFDDHAIFQVDDVSKGKTGAWTDYLKGVMAELSKLGHRVGGFEAVVYGDIPVGSGLSSSAALEVATAYFVCLLNGIDIDPIELPRLCQRAENQYVGVNCGIMDQFTSVFGKQGHALFLDCRDLSYRYLPLPVEDLVVVICDSRVRRELADSEYNRRRQECTEGVSILSRFLPPIKALRDVSMEDFSLYQAHLPDPIRKRCRHVITENDRVRRAASALERGDCTEFGRLMNESHQSLKNDYQVSCPELDLLVNIARSCPGVLGSRLTGAGFGGCTVNLVRKDSVEKLIESITDNYKTAIGLDPAVYVCLAEDGVSSIAEI